MGEEIWVFYMNYPEDFINQIIQGDCLEVMKNIPDESIDITFTSPPYNLRNSTGNGMKNGRGGKWGHALLLKGYDNYTDNLPYPIYVEWQRKCLTEMLRITKPTGAIFYNHKWRIQKGILQDRQEIICGFPVRQIIIWKRSGGINFNPGYFLPTYEVIYLIAKSKFKLNPKSNAYGDVWEITQEFNNPHPAPFPMGLAERVILSCPGELVFDPFSGSGTTCLVAKNLNKKFIGIEISEKYCKLSRERIDAVSI